MRSARTGAASALIAAVLFGISAPLAKLLLPSLAHIRQSSPLPPHSSPAGAGCGQRRGDQLFLFGLRVREGVQSRGLGRALLVSWALSMSWRDTRMAPPWA